MSLKDLHLKDTLRVQIQITDAPQIETTYATTLHYRMVYRLQNRAFDVAIPDQTNDTLLINVDSNAQRGF